LKKGDRLETLSKHIDQEKQRVKERFEEIRKNVLEIIDSKEKECLKLLEDENTGFSDLYEQYEKLVITGWLKLSDKIETETIYPTAEVLEQKISRIGSLDRLEAFVKEITQDLEIKGQYCDEKDGPEKRKQKMDHLIKCFHMAESTLPVLGGKLLMKDLEGDLESIVKEAFKDFSKQEIKVENSFAMTMKESPCRSKIIDFEQYETLKKWLNDYKNLNLKLLYRGSADGLSARTFHEKCDRKGATVTIIKCRFRGAETSSVIGGYVNQSWNSKGDYAYSSTAFLFSLTKGVSPVKCPIKESQLEYAYYGHPGFGPGFGSGFDIWIDGDCRTGDITPKSYLKANMLMWNNEKNFIVEDIEVFKVQGER